MSNGLKNIGPRYFHRYDGSLHKPDLKEKIGNHLNMLPRIAFGKKIIIRAKDDFSIKVDHFALRILAALAAILSLPISVVGMLLLMNSKSHKEIYNSLVNAEKARIFAKKELQVPQVVEKPEEVQIEIATIVEEKPMPEVVIEKKPQIVAPQQNMVLPKIDPVALKLKLKPASTNTKVTHPQGPQSPIKVFCEAFKRVLRPAPKPIPKKFDSTPLPIPKLKTVPKKKLFFKSAKNEPKAVSKKIENAPPIKVEVIEIKQPEQVILPQNPIEEVISVVEKKPALRPIEPKQQIHTEPRDLNDIFKSANVQQMINRQLENNQNQEEAGSESWDEEVATAAIEAGNSKVINIEIKEEVKFQNKEVLLPVYLVPKAITLDNEAQLILKARRRSLSMEAV